MKNLNKVSKKHVNWVLIYNKVRSPEMDEYFYRLFSKVKSKRKRSKALSQNRCAYYTLKHFYSTTTIKELLEKLCYVL